VPGVALLAEITSGLVIRIRELIQASTSLASHRTARGPTWMGEGNLPSLTNT
jgi:hypothetical protein